MALGDNYATLAELKSYMSITGTALDSQLTDALASSSREIERYCRRQFNDAGSATARTYYAVNARLVHVDDFHTTTGLIVETDDDDDGTFETLWVAADYQAEPLNQNRSGQKDWPFWRIRAVESLIFYDTRRPAVRVTARWGWTAVPSPVKQACLILAAETFQMKDAPLGVAGMGEFGVIRVRDNRMAAMKLNKYARDSVLVA